MKPPPARAPALLLALFLAACMAPTPTTPSAAPERTSVPLAADRIQILHTNDIHGKLEATIVPVGTGGFEQGGMAGLAGWVSAVRGRAPDRTVLLDGGDAWQGTFTSNANKGEAVVQAMNLMRYDAQALGNHDFDWGQDILAQRAKEAKFPFLAANLRDASGRIPPYARPYVVKDLGITKVGVIGITNPRSATIVKAASIQGLTFLPAVDGVRSVLDEVRRQADIVVVLSHAGIDLDSELASQVQEIDLIVGGHTHLALRTARTIGKVKIYQAGAYTENLGRIEVTVDRATRRLAHAAGGDVLLPIASGAVKPDPEVAKIVEARRLEGKAVTSRVLGRTQVPLEGVRGTEVPIGNLITDALLAYGRRQGWGTDVAFYNQAGVRASLPAGEITFGQLYDVLPFGNTIVQVDLSGEALREVLEGAAGNAGRLHIAGGSFTYRLANPPSERVMEATVGGEPLDPKRVYRVLTIDYLYTGGDGHTGFLKGTNVKVGDVEVDVVAEHIAANSPVNPKIEGRIVAQ
ncbi:MAG TPA: bifunctional UDP-sugar hydrolase/5'-nucleotidase [Candidatus Limnocylindria bacterium]|nr:bifunctional UDP-sugar hydrolase/5'-nucleotidase [Candidatus Limnocylindria bacterium]